MTTGVAIIPAVLVPNLGTSPGSCCTGEGGSLGGVSQTNSEGDYVCSGIEPLIFWDCLSGLGKATCVVGGQFDGTTLRVTYVINCAEQNGSPFPITTSELINGLDIFPTASDVPSSPLESIESFLLQAPQLTGPCAAAWTPFLSANYYIATACPQDANIFIETVCACSAVPTYNALADSLSNCLISASGGSTLFPDLTSWFGLSQTGPLDICTATPAPTAPSTSPLKTTVRLVRHVLTQDRANNHFHSVVLRNNGNGQEWSAAKVRRTTLWKWLLARSWVSTCRTRRTVVFK